MRSKLETKSCGTCVLKKVDQAYHVLLVKPFLNRDTWGVPKGHIHEGEPEEHCALRETREETGLYVILVERLTPVIASYQNERKTVVTWLAVQDDNKVAPRPADGENVEVRWFPLDNLPTIHIYQRSLLQEVIEKAHAVDVWFHPVLPPAVLKALDEVSDYMEDETEWMTLKKLLLRRLAPVHRTYFSTREQKTKKQWLNHFETVLIEHWFQRTGVRLVLKA